MRKRIIDWIFTLQSQRGILGEKERRLYTYAYGLLLNKIAIYAIIAIVGTITGNWIGMFSFLLPFTILRQYAGGIHLEKPMNCIIFSGFLVFGCGQYLAVASDIGNFQSSLPKEDRDATLIKEESLYKGFERSYLKNPDKIAIITPKGQYTYCECYQKAVKIGSYIIGKKIVGILMDKGMLQIASILAAAMVSTTYVPIDINNPKERIKTIIEQASVELILTTQAYLTRLKGMTCENVCVDLLEDKCVQEVIEEQPYNKEAYIIFTSGTTGIPKGVLIEHSNANNTILDINRRFSIKENDSVLGLSNIAFDLSVFDIFGIFEAGGTLVLPEDVSTKEPKVWVEMIEKNSITICNLVPMRMEMLYTYVIKNEISKESLKSIRLILISGEKVPLDLPDKIHSIMPNARIVCLGGATEASIWSNYYEPKEINNKWFSIPYGYPLTNQKYYVMNADGLICPDNVPGELCIAGEGLAKEYVNDKKLTIEKFQYKGCLKSIKQISCISSQKREPLWKWLGRLFMWSDLRKTIFVRIKIICWMNWKEGYRSI